MAYAQPSKPRATLCGYIYNENDTSAQTEGEREDKERQRKKDEQGAQNENQMTSVKLAREFQHVVGRSLTKNNNNTNWRRS